MASLHYNLYGSILQSFKSAFVYLLWKNYKLATVKVLYTEANKYNKRKNSVTNATKTVERISCICPTKLATLTKTAWTILDISIQKGYLYTSFQYFVVWKVTSSRITCQNLRQMSVCFRISEVKEPQRSREPTF